MRQGTGVSSILAGMISLISLLQLSDMRGEMVSDSERSAELSTDTHACTHTHTHTHTLTFKTHTHGHTQNTHTHTQNTRTVTHTQTSTHPHTHKIHTPQSPNAPAGPCRPFTLNG